MYPMNMKSLPLIFLLLALAIPSFAADLTLKDAPAQVYFSPKGGGQDALVQTIGKANVSILVQTYSFTCPGLQEGVGGFAGEV